MSFTARRLAAHEPDGQYGFCADRSRSAAGRPDAFPDLLREKRDFFLDGSTFFDFQSTAAAGNSLLPFVSRRIGLSANGDPQKIDVGGKLAGQFGANDVGALYVRTGEAKMTQDEKLNRRENFCSAPLPGRSLHP